MNCVHCGREIKEETDDMITCGGMWPVWYHETDSGKRAMSCTGLGGQCHEPSDALVSGNADPA